MSLSGRPQLAIATVSPWAARHSLTALPALTSVVMLIISALVFLGVFAVGNPIDVLIEFRANYPALPVVVVSASDRHSDVIKSIDLGAMGFVPKRASNDTLLEALQQVISGCVYVPPMSMGSDFQPTLNHSSPLRQIRQEAEGSDYQTMPSLRQLGLTVRQTDVLNLLLKGQPNKLIARELGLSVETVKDHVAAVLRTLGVSSRTQAVIAVSQMLQKQGGGVSLSMLSHLPTR